MTKNSAAKIALLAIALAGVAHGNGFRTGDPVKAFVQGEYPPGDDYFINGNKDTYIFRCLMTRPAHPFEGVALSEISIWGNRAGPWEIFRKEKDGNFVHVETKYLIDTSCLENCRTKEYLSTGQCRWEHGWPKP